MPNYSIAMGRIDKIFKKFCTFAPSKKVLIEALPYGIRQIDMYKSGVLD